MEELVTKFAEANTVAGQAAVLSDIVKKRVLHQAAKDTRFERGVRRLATAAGEAQGALERLGAVAALGRIGSGVKSWQARIGSILEETLVTPLPSLVLISEADDRFYVARMWRYAKQPWFAEYFAAATVEEDTADRVRGECIEGLLNVSTDFCMTLKALCVPLQKIRFDTQKPGDSMGRRVRRILDALKSRYAVAPIEPGEDAGNEIRNLIVRAFELSGLPETDGIRAEVAENVVGLVHELVRARFSLSTDAKTYAALEVVRGWFGQSDWSGFARVSVSTALVQRDITEALSLLLRAGVSDDLLYSRLEIAAAGPTEAREIAIHLSNQVAGLPEHLIDWLSGRAPRIKSTLATESQFVSLDEVLADLLLEVRQLLAARDSVGTEVLPEIAVIAPRLSQPLQTLVEVVGTVENAVALLLSKRSLRARGSPGDIVEFSPLEHEMMDGPQPGIRFVRLVRPVVEAVTEKGPPRIVRKGLVQAA